MTTKPIRLLLSLVVLASLTGTLVLSLPAFELASASSAETTGILSQPGQIAKLSKDPLQTSSFLGRLRVDTAVQNRMEQQGSSGYHINFRERPDLSPAYSMGWEERGQYVYQTLSEASERSQKRVREYLDSQKIVYHHFWISNVIIVESSGPESLNALAGFSEVKSITDRPKLGLIEPVETEIPEADVNAITTITANIDHVNAPDAWGMGFTGTGIVVASIDTGVLYTHNALKTKYRGYLGASGYDHNYNWWDPYQPEPTDHPTDGHGHGTHTMGIMVGDDGSTHQIGVAPGAKWIACRGCSTSECGSRELLECATFLTAPWDLQGKNPDTDLRPQVINNSWGDCEISYDGWFQDAVDTWHAAGIYPIFSNGNSTAVGCSNLQPPPEGTVGNPARYGNVTGVGSTGTSNGLYATYSNKGPTDNLDTVNPRGYPTLKPQVAAPGVTIYSSINIANDYYTTMTGTSMSAPHVAGLLALVWQAGPCLIGNYAASETLIEQTATPIYYETSIGDYPNYATGWGEIDALAAVTQAQTDCWMNYGTLQGTVQDINTHLSLAGVKIDAVLGDIHKSNLSGADGTYTIPYLLPGSYTVTASAFGYMPRTVTGINITATNTSTLDFELLKAKMIFLPLILR